MAKTARRSSKWYNKNERETMLKFGFVPTIRSGAGWKEKEDGYSDSLICQHKSTDANGYRLSRVDLDKLEYHAAVDHKVPVFMVQFLSDNKVYLVLEPQYFDDVYKHLNGLENSSEGKTEPLKTMLNSNDDSKPKRKVIKSSSDKQTINDKLKNEREEMYNDYRKRKW